MSVFAAALNGGLRGVSPFGVVSVNGCHPWWMALSQWFAAPRGGVGEQTVGWTGSFSGIAWNAVPPSHGGLLWVFS